MIYAKPPVDLTVDILKSRINDIQDRLSTHYLKKQAKEAGEVMRAVQAALSDMAGLKTNYSMLIKPDYAMNPSRWDKTFLAIQQDLGTLFKVQDSIEKAVISNFNYSESEYMWLNGTLDGVENKIDRFYVVNNKQSGNVTEVEISFGTKEDVVDERRTTLSIDSVAGVLTLPSTTSENILLARLKKASCVGAYNAKIGGKTYTGSPYYGQMFGCLGDTLSGEEKPRPSAHKHSGINNQPNEMHANMLKEITDLAGSEANADTFAEAEVVIINKTKMPTNYILPPGNTEMLSTGPVVVEQDKNLVTEIELILHLTYEISPSKISQIRIIPFNFGTASCAKIQCVKLTNSNGGVYSVADWPVTGTIDSGNFAKFGESESESAGAISDMGTGGIKPISGTLITFQAIPNIQKIEIVIGADKTGVAPMKYDIVEMEYDVAINRGMKKW